MLKAVLYDFNGTILNDMGLTYRSVCEVFRTYGVQPPSIDEWFEGLGSNYMDHYYFYGIPRGNFLRDKEKVNSIRDAFIEVFWNECHIRPNARFSITWCRSKGLKTGIVSAETERLLMRRIKEENMEYLFDIIFANASPKRSFLGQALLNLGVLAEEALYIDDTYEGLKTARDLGMMTIGFMSTGSYGTYQDIVNACPDNIIASMADLTPYLSRLLEVK